MINCSARREMDRTSGSKNIEYDRQAERQISRQANKQIVRQTDKKRGVVERECGVGGAHGLIG